MGDAALLATIGDAIDLATTQRVWALAETIRRRLGGSAVHVVPAYASVLVGFDPLLTSLAAVMASVRGAIEADEQASGRRPRRVRVGVCFGQEFGPDFDEVAHMAHMRGPRLRDAVCKADYRVAFLGFLAGFPYLLGLPASLAMPRLATPRARVPGGSVAIAAGQCGIYPRDSPGGWRLLGRTAARIFDMQRDPAPLLMPGDAVTLEPVDDFGLATAEVRR